MSQYYKRIHHNQRKKEIKEQVPPTDTYLKVNSLIESEGSNQLMLNQSTTY